MSGIRRTQVSKEEQAMQLISPHKIEGHAIVIGGSIAGLFATRVLSDYFETVTLVERDRIIPNQGEHPGVPQSGHAHILLAKGLDIASQLFPDLVDSLKQNGATELNFSEEVRWHHFGGYKVRCRGRVSVLSQSRALLEAQVRQRVEKLSNVILLSQHTVEDLLTTPDHTQVIGVRFKPNAQADYPECLSADLVVDTTGRNSRAPQWLSSMGYKTPKETEVTVNVGYTSRIYRQNAKKLEYKGCIISANPPQGMRGGVIAPIEGDRWIVTLAGYLGDYPPAEDKAFLNFSRSLPTPDIYDFITNSEPLSEPIPYKFASSLRRHYEKLTQFPEGYLVLGDALCSFNPIFGQGMTVAALEAQALGDCLREHSNGIKGLAQNFFTKAARIIDIPWSMATGEDIRYPEVIGERSFKISLLNWYISRIYRAAHHDPCVYDSFLQVMHMMRSPIILFNPVLMTRILKTSLLHRSPISPQLFTLDSFQTHLPLMQKVKK
jgi:2-polyprenyl-6-methoxyphenol hydroxylase-like FAD-dependent oxidoreductase